MDAVSPGDILAVRTPSKVFGPLIRFGAWLRHMPDTVDHVAIAHHTDTAGRLWLVEGRPGGVGWADAAEYDSRWILTNADQPKTDEQRAEICRIAAALLRTQYDWGAIIGDAAAALRLDRIWRLQDFGDKAPGHVVCSSLASYIYHRVGLAEPSTPERSTTPGDWAQFCLSNGWR